MIIALGWALAIGLIAIALVVAIGWLLGMLDW
jgi:hypothetical protein